MAEKPPPAFACRPLCAACCTEPSLSSPIPAFGGKPGLPGGKPAGLPCPRLTEDLRCELFGLPERPAVCSSLRASEEMCGRNREEALAYLRELEILTRP